MIASTVVSGQSRLLLGWENKLDGFIFGMQIYGKYMKYIHDNMHASVSLTDSDIDIKVAVTASSMYSVSD